MDRGAAFQNLAVSVIERCTAGLDLDGVRAEVLPRVRRAVPVDAFWLATVDPATLLFTRAHREEIPERVTPYFIENEFLADDVNKWVELARDQRGVRTLFEATRGRPENSARYRDIFQPLGLGDELRVVLRVKGVCWGYMCLHREKGATFTAQEADYIRQLAPHIANAIRTSMLLASAELAELEDAPGLITLAPDGSFLSATSPGERWLEELRSPEYSLPLEFHALAARLRRLGPSDRALPRVTVRTRAGRWAVLYACWMPTAGDSSIAVIVEQATPVQVAPTVMLAYGLTEQERTVTGLSCRGRSTREIAEQLCLSQHTVRDHLKSIFGKVGVSSGRELTATILQQQYLPRAKTATPLGPSGFYAE
jgi:DNA-binding CsgD family transcriptional regulator